MYCLVFTGGIGSGKSYAANILAAMGIPLYVADSRAKYLYESDALLLAELRSMLGDEIVSSDGRIDRKIFARKIFSDRSLLKEVESVVHPAVLRDFERWRAERSAEGERLGVFESALFAEAKIFHHIADKVVVVTAPIEMRIARIMKRDRLSPEQVMQRINNQISEEKQIEIADFVIFADGKRAVLPQIMALLSTI